MGPLPSTPSRVRAFRGLSPSRVRPFYIPLNSIDELRRTYGDDFQSIIYPKKLDEQISERLPDGFRTMTLGNVKSNNEFSTEPVGLVTNSIDPGDDYVLNLLAARRFDAGPETTTCSDCSGEGCSECEGGIKRARGRGFTGPDSTKADEMLDGVWSHTIAQAVGRWARKPEESGAIVFVRTSTVPGEMVDVQIEREKEFKDGQKAIVSQLEAGEGMSAKEISEAANVTKRHAQDTLNNLAEQGIVVRIKEAGKNGADLYMPVAEIPKNGYLGHREI